MRRRGTKRPPMGDLEAQIRDVLGRLSLLSEAASGNLEAHVSRSAPESSSPAGVTVRDLSDDADRARSLYVWYRTQFERNADNPDRLLSLRLAAEREYLRRVDPILHSRTAEKGSILAYSQDGATVEDIAAQHMIDEFEGVDAQEVAIIEGKREAWVEKVRRQHGRDPRDGRPLPEFRGWDEGRRRSAIHRLAGEGLSKRAVAGFLGVDEKTVRRYWPSEDDPALEAAA